MGKKCNDILEAKDDDKFPYGKPGHIKRNCRVNLSAQVITKNKEDYGFAIDNGSSFKLKGIYIYYGCTEHMITDKIITS
uniref:Retrovirus-related Pol polyprotein from transposon TNT 1-94 n=1 Tax=Strongyloides venezuelensis TaxID=75913 RepID=A0A0K0G636_STRVS